MSRLTQGAPEHEVVFVADPGGAFGEHLLFNTSEARPIVGTQGLRRFPPVVHHFVIRRSTGSLSIPRSRADEGDPASAAPEDAGHQREP